MEEQNFELRMLLEYNSAEEFFGSDKYVLINFNQLIMTSVNLIILLLVNTNDNSDESCEESSSKTSETPETSETSETNSSEITIYVGKTFRNWIMLKNL